MTEYGWSQTKPNVEESIGGQTPRSTFRRDFYNIGSSVNVGALYGGIHYWTISGWCHIWYEWIIGQGMISEAMGSSVWILSDWGRLAPGMDRGTDAEPPRQRRSSNGHRCSTRFRINTRCLSHVCHHVSHVIRNPTHSQKGWKINTFAQIHKKVVKV